VTLRHIGKALAPGLAILLTACALGSARDQDSGAPTLIPAALSGSTPAPLPADTPGSPPQPAGEAVQYGVWLHPGLPPSVVAAAAPLFDDPAFGLSNTPGEAAVQITLLPGDAAALKSNWLYAVVAPFPTLPEDIAWESLGRYWQGDPGALPNFGAPQLILSPDVAEMLSVMYGPVAPGVPLTVVPVEQVLDTTWANRPALSVVPFESLEPRWKVLTVNGQSPLQKDLNTLDYRLSVEIGLTGDPTIAAQAAQIIQSAGEWQATNFDPARLTYVTLTGVTALSRAVAWNMERVGVDVQGANIKPVLADADILHISNEVSFAIDCPPPDPVGEPKFCSDDRYMALLRDLGPDAIELTGNHINDWGTGAFVRTLDIYDQNGILYFGGGRNLEEARQTLFLDHAGNRIAFLGCNLPGPNTAWATGSSAGAAPCDDYADFKARVAAAQEVADVVIATQQYWEFEHVDPTPQQVADFTGIVDAGADIVSGSQAHQPQTLAFHNDRFVHYGLSNLFFDPFEDIEKQFFIDKHIIYAGRHISTVLLTGRIENYGRPRPMTPGERDVFLAEMFAASGW
jgi:poly-gamma-glutamate synthesis protein (capsule biosynthesis protein)